MNKEEKIVRLKWTVPVLFEKVIIVYKKIHKATRGLKKGYLHKIPGFCKTTKYWRFTALVPEVRNGAADLVLFTENTELNNGRAESPIWIDMKFRNTSYYTMP